MRNKPKHEEHGNEESWLLPYSDLMTLLLAVFIVLFASSQIDASKAEAISAAFQTILGIEGGAEIPEGSKGIMLGDGMDLLVVNNPADTNDETDTKNEAEIKKEAEIADLEKIQQELMANTGVLEMGDNTTIFIDDRGLVVSLSNAILFDSGKADLKIEIEQMLSQIGININEFTNYIRVEGHTDNVPVNRESFPSNWELSSARASRVVRFLIDECGILPERLSAVGYGEFKPLDTNNTEEGRALNRRVDIIILSSKYNDLEIVPFTTQSGGQIDDSSW